MSRQKHTPRRDAAEMADARQARLAAIVIAGAVLLRFGLIYLGEQRGWEQRYLLLIEFATLAAIFWALVVSLRIWRRSRKN